MNKASRGSEDLFLVECNTSPLFQPLTTDIDALQHQDSRCDTVISRLDALHSNATLSRAVLQSLSIHEGQTRLELHSTQAGTTSVPLSQLPQT